MKFLLLTIIALLLVKPYSTAQSSAKPKSNTLSLELGKTGLIYNLVFDHRFKSGPMGVRATIGSNFSRYLSLLTTGAGAYYLTGKANRHLELGVDLNYLVVDEVSDDQRGLQMVYPDYTIKTAYTSFNIGYRSYSQQTMFRIGLSPGFTKEEFVPGGYISVGWRFSRIVFR